LIDRLSQLAPEPAALLSHLRDEKDVSVRRALVLIIGGLPADRRSPAFSAGFIELLLTLYKGDADQGIHSAAEWALRRWNQTGKLREAEIPLATGEPIDHHGWYLTRTSKHTMIKVTPVPFQMGAEAKDKAREGDESPHTRIIPEPYFVSAHEVSALQFLAFRPEFKDRFLREQVPKPDGPIYDVTWYDAVAYCRWLSEKENIEPDQMCFPDISKIKPGMALPDNVRNRTGYRLLWEDEWEFSCRAGTVTSRFFGADEEMLTRYAWFQGNLEGGARTCGLLMPNGFGLFDMLGNVKEWCHDVYRRDLTSPRPRDLGAVDSQDHRVARGGTYADRAHVLRASNRYHNVPDARILTMGFRIARTAPSKR
jgi:formylglycine-generating enzyme required for sulfatase activity